MRAGLPGRTASAALAGVIVRNTLSQLTTTALETIKTVIPPEIMSYHVSNHTVRIRFNDVDSEWILLPLDTPDKRTPAAVTGDSRSPG